MLSPGYLVPLSSVPFHPCAACALQPLAFVGSIYHDDNTITVTTMWVPPLYYSIHQLL